MTVRPDRSSTVALEGGASLAGPIAVMRPSAMTMVRSVWAGAPVPSMMVTCVSAIRGAVVLTKGWTAGPGATGGGRTRGSSFESWAVAVWIVQKTSRRAIVVMDFG